MVERGFASVSALLYTIPSLAFFEFFVPVTGLGTVTVEIGLVGYTLLILFRNALQGLRSVGGADGTAGAFDTDELVTLKSFAQTRKLTTISQLKGLGSLKLGDYPPERTRYQGHVGLQQVYGLTNLQFVPLAAGSPIYNALDSGQVQVGDAFSTDAQLLSGKYAPLSDPHHIFGFQHVALVINASLLKQLGPAFTQTYDQLTSLLTTPAMQAMNKEWRSTSSHPSRSRTSSCKRTNCWVREHGV